MTHLFIAYFARELGALIACGALWALSAGGLAIRRPRMRRAHFRLLDWFVHGMARRVIDLLRLSVAFEPTPEAGVALMSERPLLVFSRHAGPGETLLLVDELVTRYQRLPSIVFKDTLTLDPTVDLIGHRLPHAILDTSDTDACEREIAHVAAGLGRPVCSCCSPREATSPPSAGAPRCAGCGGRAGDARPASPRR